MTTPPRLTGRRLLVARLIWLAAAAAALALAIGTVPDLIREAGTIAAPEQRTFSQLTPAEVQVLQDLGVPISAYVAFVVAWILSPLLVYILLASVIIWRRSDDGVAFAVALILVTIGAAVPFLSGITVFRPGWQTAVHAARALGIFALLLLTYIFPDGRFVPRWTPLVAALWAAWVLHWLVWPGSPYGLVDRTGALTPVGLLYLVLGFGSGAWAQVYRYRRTANPIQRQQAKVFAFGFASVLGLYLIAVVPNFALPAVTRPGWPYFLYGLLAVPLLTRAAFTLIPVFIGFAILRYRLWDIDLIIRRTLIYGALTGSLAVVYAGTVVVLQPLFAALTGQRQSELSTVLSTLAIAALFGPLRGQLQSVIDRRFYRRRYDAAKTLADFAATAEDEVDVNRLADRLMSVVEEAVQPGHISLWLRPPPANDGQPGYSPRRQKTA